MTRFKLLMIAALVLGGCNESGFEGEAKTKAPPPKSVIPTTGDALPEGKERDFGAGQTGDTNCTDLTEADCHAKKISEGAKTSYRNVLCRTLSVEQCHDAIQTAKIADGKEGSRIRVIGCESEGGCDSLAREEGVEYLESEDVQPPPDQGINIGDDERLKKIDVFKMNENVALDGRSYIEINYQTGLVSFGSNDSNYGLVRFQFDIQRGDGSTAFVSQNGYNTSPTPGKQGISQGSVQIPDWPKQCGANPTPVAQLRYGYVGGGNRDNPPSIRINNSGTSVRIAIDDSVGGRGGAITFKNLSLNLTPCP